MEGDSCGVFRISGGLQLRLLGERDAAELHALIEENRPYLARWLPWAAGQTPAETEGFVARCHEQLLGNDGFQAAVIVDGSIAGMAGFPRVDWANRLAGIGYWLAEDRQGRGVMTACVRRLADHAFGAWDLSRVEIRAATGNRRSRALPERLGFDQEGILREAELVGDRRLDLAVYAMPAAGWPVRTSWDQPGEGGGGAQRRRR
jgi:ribosomal-protein-serine acetyltransferase